MPQLTQDKFFGIAPNRDAISGQALVAENVDLSGGGLKPIKAPSLVEAGHSGEIAYYKNTWISGAYNYIVTEIQGLPSVVYKNVSGTWKVRVNGGPETNLWVDAPTDFTVEGTELLPPATPVLINLTSGDVPANTYEYFITFAEEEDGKVLRESDPSAPTEITLSEQGSVKVTRPPLRGAPSSGATWRIYRRIKGSSAAGLVATKGVWETQHTDNQGPWDLKDTIIPERRDYDNYQYKYVLVWVREIEGWETESTPSEIYSVNQSAEGVTISMDEGIDIPEYVTKWRIYRLSLGKDPTTTFQLVAELPIVDVKYVDYKDNIDLGAALRSSYRADNGALVSAGIPDKQFDGMAGPFNGFLVGWIGYDLYLSEPGNPSWWPGAYVVQANFPIKAVSQAGGNIAVVTEGGAQLGYGVSPDAFALSQSVFGEGGKYRTASDKNFYLGYSGIYEIGGEQAKLVSTDFPREFFDDLVNPWMVMEKEKLFLFHQTGALVYDLRSAQWSTLASRDHSFSAIYESGGEIYGLRNNAIVKLFGSDDDSTMVYQGTSNFSDSGIKRVEALRLYGTGDCRVELSSIEDLSTVESEGEIKMNSGFEDDREIFAPYWLSTEAICYKIAGRATVRSIMFTVDKTNTET